MRAALLTFRCRILFSTKMSKEQHASVDKDFIVSSFTKAGRVEAFHHRWMTSDTWATLICSYYAFSNELHFNGGQLLRALGTKTYAHLQNEMRERNNIPHGHIGIFRDHYQTRSGKRVHCFYATPQGEAPRKPPNGEKWHEHISDGEDLLKIKTRQQRANIFNNTSAPELELPPPSKKRKAVHPPPTPALDDALDYSAAAQPSIPTAEPETPPFLFWKTPKVMELFRPLPDESDALEAISNQIELFVAANEAPMSYLTIVELTDDNNEDDEEERLSENRIWCIRHRCQILCAALRIAKENLPKGETWNGCCEQAKNLALMMGITITKNSRTVRNWYQDFRAKRKFRVNALLPGKHNLPPFLQQNADICERIQQYAREHLHELSIEFMCEYLHDCILPKMVEERNGITRESNEESYNKELKTLLREYGLTCLSQLTVYRWIKKLGFKYEQRRKGYYVDGHEKPSTIQYREDFVSRYLRYEQYMHRWIQITLTESQELENKGLLTINSGYRYKDNAGNDMVEYHVDCCHLFQERMNKETKFGGNLSVRKPADKRPMIAKGHDECIFKQNLMPKKSWTGPNGESVLVPKDDGQGIMISAFQSREFGFGLQITEEEMRRVNLSREGKRYCDEEAAKKYRNGPMKQKLESNPFVFEFSYGANNDGYWNYERMVLQLEDCVDVLKELYNEYDFYFLFDHSCGHDRQREDGLNVERMSKGYAGKQAFLHETKIKQREGYLGPYPSTLTPGETQYMVFREGDPGPFWMEPQEREATRKDKIIENTMIRRPFTKAELTLKLQQIGAAVPGNMKQIKKACVDRGIPLVDNATPKVIPGWEGKQKGMLQVLWERGKIDSNRLHMYTVNGTKDAFGVIQRSSA